MSAAIATALSLLIISLLLIYPKARHQDQRLPPGPKRLPLVGNLFDLTLKELWLRARVWAEQYGDIVYLRVFGQGILILNTFEVASDLLETRGTIYSDKPQTVISSEMCGCDRIVAFAPYGEACRRQRRLLHSALGPASVPAYRSSLRSGATVLLKGLLDAPKDYTSHIRRYACSRILSVVYGYRVTNDDDPILEKAEKTLFLLSNHIVSIGSCLAPINIFPLLRALPSWVPGIGVKREAPTWRAQIEDCATTPFEWVKNTLRDGTAAPSFCAELLTKEASDAEVAGEQVESDIMWAAHAMYIATIDTTLVLLTHFILAMVRYPDVARKAQEEIDGVTGRRRLPIYEDRAALPFVEAVLTECMRWTAPVPLGLPRLVMEDDVYNGYTIPAGTLVLINIWAMSRDTEQFPNPGEFVPERFLEGSGPSSRALDPRNFIFGFGRRKCAGTYLADSYLWIAIVGMLATFDFRKSIDSSGKVIEPQTEYNDASMRLMTSAFPCEILPRSDVAIELLHEALAHDAS